MSGDVNFRRCDGFFLLKIERATRRRTEFYRVYFRRVGGPRPTQRMIYEPFPRPEARTIEGAFEWRADTVAFVELKFLLEESAVAPTILTAISSG